MQALADITPPELEDLLYLLISESSAQRLAKTLLPVVCELGKEAVEQLSVKTTGDLFVHAAAMGDCKAVLTLHAHLPAAQTLSVATFSSFLRAAADSGLLAQECKVVLGVCGLSALREVDAATVLHMLEKVAKSDGDTDLYEIIALMPAAKQVDAAAVQKLLNAAIADDKPHVVSEFCGLPGAQQLGKEAIAQLMERGMQVWGEELGAEWEPPSVPGQNTLGLSSLAAQVQCNRYPQSYDHYNDLEYDEEYMPTYDSDDDGAN